MHANFPYDPVSLMQFQVSMLSLAAALELPAPIGTKDLSNIALAEAERLRAWVVQHKK